MFCCWSFPGGSDGRESACSAGDPGLIPGLGRPLGGGNGLTSAVLFMTSYCLMSFTWTYGALRLPQTSCRERQGLECTDMVRIRAALRLVLRTPHVGPPLCPSPRGTLRLSPCGHGSVLQAWGWLWEAEKSCSSPPPAGREARVASGWSPGPPYPFQALLTSTILLEHQLLPIIGHHGALGQSQRPLSHFQTRSVSCALGGEARQHGHVCMSF